MVEEGVDVKEALREVRLLIQNACENRPDDLKKIIPRLVAVSKTKPVELIVQAYEEGQRNFGENYPQELVSKSNDPEILNKCPAIRWHFIGHLQSNKVNKLLSIPNLYAVETVDSKKLAKLIDQSFAKIRPEEKLNVFVQINTSEEADKKGVPPNEAVDLSKYVIEECPHLSYRGLMTIGQFGRDLSMGPNPDFLKLVECKKTVSEELDLPLNDIELSMGMSDDYVHAIELGSTNVRVGSYIFGKRTRKVKIDPQ